MKMHLLSTAIALIALALPLATARARAPVSEAEALRLGTEAYLYGYPLVTMEMTRRVMTNVVSPKNNHSPMGQFFHARTYPDASFRDITAPNADTLYSTVWLDLSAEPYILSLPDEADRYYLMPMLSAWTEVFQVPGKRTTGTKAQIYAITGPGWQGSLPAGVTELKSPTALIWILGRTYCTGTPEDYQKVHAIQDQYAIVPMSAYGKPYTPPRGKIDPSLDMKTPVRTQVNHLDAGSYFKLLAALMKQNPPTVADAPIVAAMAKLGIIPGQDFEISRLDPAVARGLGQVPAAGVKAITLQMTDGGTRANGWTYTLKTGLYGTDYLQRAAVTAFGLGANRPQDAVYPYSLTDQEGKPLSGTNKYVIRFPKGQTPPVDGFWSLTMYDPEFFFVANSLNRYTVSPRNDLKLNNDGSVNLYIQNESPGADKESNWLPAPERNFILMLRMYDPRASVIDGSWVPPAVQAVK